MAASMVLLSLLAVPLVLGIAASVSRRIWWERRAAARHHQAIEVLGRITKEQAEASGAIQAPTGASHSNLRVIPTDSPEPPRPPPRRRVSPSKERSPGPVEPPADAPPVVTGGLPSRLPPAVPPPVTSRRMMPPFPPAPPTKAGPAAPALWPGDAPAAKASLPVSAPAEGAEAVAAVGAGAAETFAKEEVDGAQAGEGQHRMLHFDDTPPDGMMAIPMTSPGVTGSPRRRVRPRRQVMAISALIAVVLVGAGVGAWATLRSGGSKPAASSRPPVSVRTQSTTPVTRATPPTTSLPPVTGPVQQSASGQTVWVYRVPAAAHLTLQANGPCWVQARENDSFGPTVYMTTMAGGQTASLNAPVWIRLGFTNVAFSVNGTAVAPPPVPVGAVYNVLFET